MQKRGSKRSERHQSEQDERGCRRQKTVPRIGGINRGEGHGRPGRRQDRRNVGNRRCGDGGDALLAAGPFAGQQQGESEQAAQHRAHFGAEQPGLDRIAHHEEAAERQRQPADPHHPAGADGFLEAAIGLRQRRGRCCGATGSGLLLFLGGSCGFNIGNKRRRRWCDPRRSRWQRFFERLKRRERWRHGGGGGGRPDCLQPRPQVRDLVHGLSRERKGDNRDREREEIERQIEHRASRRSKRFSEVDTGSREKRVRQMTTVTGHVRSRLQSSECSFNS